jgi:hypothetical protein
MHGILDFLTPEVIKSSNFWDIKSRSKPTFRSYVASLLRVEESFKQETDMENVARGVLKPEGRGHCCPSNDYHAQVVSC